ncbi:MAG: hypothetical protein ACYTFA_09335 [Planctomycetota bacterium]|jgi:hypothetical protein
MTNQLTASGMVAAVTLSFAVDANAAIYRVSPAETDVLAGTTTSLSAEVETEAGDNVVGFGYFSFAVDLTVTGTAGATATDIANILINETAFDDLLSNSVGFPQGSQYLNIAGVTTDFMPPTFGENVGDITWLFDFDLAVPVTAELGNTITIMPSEGAMENLIANLAFDNVAPQSFGPATLTVVPEPSSATLCLVVAGVAMLTRRRLQAGSSVRTGATKARPPSARVGH